MLPNVTFLVMTDWQIFVSSGAFQSCISNCCILLVEKAFREAKDTDVVESSTYQAVCADLRACVNKDLTTSTKSLYKKYPLKYDPQGWGSANCLSISRVVQKKLEQLNHSERLQKARSFGWRVREAEPIFKLLKEARNVAAHDMRPREEAGWQLIIPSSVIRITELCPHSRDQISDIEQMNKVALDQIRSLQINEMTPEDGAEVDEGLEQYKDLVQRLDIVQQILQSSARNVPKQSDTGLYHEQESEEISPPEQEWITPQLLKKELLKLKEDCKARFVDNVEYSHSKNFFQLALVNDVMTFKPASSKECLRLSNFGWRYQENIHELGVQYKHYRDAIDELLKRVDWDD